MCDSLHQRTLDGHLGQYKPHVYGPYTFVDKSGQKLLLVQCLSALYGTMVAELLYYKKFVKSLPEQGFKLNLNDVCVVNKTVNDKQIKTFFHVDDCNISYESSKVVDATIDWLQAEYESIFKDGLGAMKVNRGKITNIWVCLWTSQKTGNVV